MRRNVIAFWSLALAGLVVILAVELLWHPRFHGPVGASSLAASTPSGAPQLAGRAGAATAAPPRTPAPPIQPPAESTVEEKAQARTSFLLDHLHPPATDHE